MAILASDSMDGILHQGRPLRCSLPWLIFQLLVDVSNCTLMSSTSSPSHPSLLGDAALERLGQRPHAVDHPHSLLRRQHRAAGRARSLAALLGKVCNTLYTKMYYIYMSLQHANTEHLEWTCKKNCIK